MGFILKDGKFLVVDGKLATHEDCCCGGIEEVDVIDTGGFKLTFDDEFTVPSDCANHREITTGGFKLKIERV